MKREILTRMMAQSVIEQGLRGLQDDPHRSLRRLVDFGSELANGPYQKNFINLFRRLLKPEDCPYYNLAQNAVRDVSHSRLKTCALGLGWNSLTVGAARIRTLEAEKRHNIPWSLTLHLDGGAYAMNSEQYEALVHQAVDLGIYSYFLVPDESAAALSIALELVNRAPDCVFFLLLPEQRGEMEQLPASSVPDNLIIGLSTDRTHWRSDVQRLRNAGCLYALYRAYSTPEEVREITSGSWAAEIAPDMGMATVCVARHDCPPNLAEQVCGYTLRSRLSPQYPTFFVDFYTDNHYADRCISGDACFMGVLPDGTVTEYCDGHETAAAYSVFDAPLSELLARYFQK